MPKLKRAITKKSVTIFATLFFPIITYAQWWNPFSNSSKIGTLESAQQHFIEEAQYMTKREALEKEINYYKEPRITVKRKVRDLTGKEAIHECNLLEKDCYGEKQYAIDHPNDIVGAEYYFEGVFTHYNHGYNTRKAKVLCINGGWFVIEKFTNNSEGQTEDTNEKRTTSSDPIIEKLETTYDENFYPTVYLTVSNPSEKTITTIEFKIFYNIPGMDGNNIFAHKYKQYIQKITIMPYTKIKFSTTISTEIGNYKANQIWITKVRFSDGTIKVINDY